jgi:hypothetical protein
LKVPAHTQPLEEAVDQVNTAESREMVAREHDTDTSGASAMAQMPLQSKKSPVAITLILAGLLRHASQFSLRRSEPYGYWISQ